MLLTSGATRAIACTLLSLLAAACCCLGPVSADLPSPSAYNSSRRAPAAAREPRAGRVRRFIYFPEGSTVTVTVDFVIPLGDSGASLTFSPSITFTPTTIARATYGHGGHGGHEAHSGYGDEARSFATDQTQLLDTIHDGFKQVGLDGGACLKRLICEVSGAPKHQDGLLGEVFNTVLLHDYADIASNEVGTELTLFTNSSGAWDGSETSNKHASEELAAARLHGRLSGDCAARYSSCPVSIFNIL